MPGWQPNCGSTGEIGRVTRSGSDDRRQIRRSAVLLATIATLGLGVAAVSVHAAAGAAMRDAGLATGGTVGLALLFVVVALVAAVRYREHVRTTEAATTAQDRLRQATIVVLFASAAFVPFALLLLRRPSTGGTGDEFPLTPVSGGALPSVAVPTRPSHAPGRNHGFSFELRWFLLTVLIVIGVLLMVFMVVVAIRLLRKIPAVSPSAAAAPIAQSQAEDEALADALLAGRSALAGDDARAAIIACYAAMEESLELVGVLRERSDSPSDLLRRAMIRDLPGTGTHAQTLTDLFREARFSTHPMSAQQLESARNALDGVTAALAERTRAREAAP